MILPTRTNVLAKPPRSPMIFPSILGADFTRIGEECDNVLALGAEGLHIDIMDGHFVPNLSMGAVMVKWLRKRYEDVYLDVHLMVERPEEYVQPFADAGSDNLTFHIEATIGKKTNNERDLIKQIRAAGCQVGIAINPPTTAESIAHVIDDVDMVLVMSVQPGFAGQAFMPHVLEKTRAIKALLKKNVRLEMDGGINDRTAYGVIDAGCDVIVAASALFDAKDRKAMMHSLRAG
jgi:ribulose-phosphate 3-epimerase